MTRIFYTLVFVFSVGLVQAQDVNPRPLTIEEYEKAKTFEIKDLDKETYVKFENVYILDRYEAKKPYFITGDDGLKKRIDLYKLIAKTGMQELGLMIFYTNETGKVYKALLPNFTAAGPVWERYFEDIHTIDKEEKNFVLKLSYVLSKEVGFQLFKAINQGKDMSKESATYGNDICFPGDQLVNMEDGSKKMLNTLKIGDKIITVEAGVSKTIQVKKLIEHDAKNYAVTELLLVSAKELTENEIVLSGKLLRATPNHPMTTTSGNKEIGKIMEGESLLCFNEITKAYESYTVISKTEFAGGVQKVYNIETDGNSFMMNDVMVLQK
ncbi:MAG TPA: hypothetical protein VFE57_01245 [Cyclobacteriaceae bacterium]|nr:hypothetical protein [Cyclobacteriaceae bacterium]